MVTLAAELFEAFVAPAALGRKTHLLQPIGVRAAQALGEQAASIDQEMLRDVQIALVSEARKLVPVDVLSPPSADDWMLFAAWHDLFVAAHPDWNQPLRRHLAKRVLAHAYATAQRVGLPQTVSAALTRHVWIAALKSLVRVDTKVAWWARHVDSPASPVDSAAFAVGSALDDEMYQRVYSLCLALSPLTDIAAAHRDSPPFAWTEASLALVTTAAGRRLATRTIRQWDEPSRARARHLFSKGDVRLPEGATAALNQFVNELDA